MADIARERNGSTTGEAGARSSRSCLVAIDRHMQRRYASRTRAMKNERETRRSSTVSSSAIAMDRAISAECIDPELLRLYGRDLDREKRKTGAEKKGREGGGGEKWRALERNRERANAGERDAQNVTDQGTAEGAADT